MSPSRILNGILLAIFLGYVAAALASCIVQRPGTVRASNCQMNFVSRGPFIDGEGDYLISRKDVTNLTCSTLWVDPE